MATVAAADLDRTAGGSDFDPAGLTQRQLGAAVARELGHKGFCSVQLGLKLGLLEDVLRDARTLGESGRLSRPSTEIAFGLLGAAGSSRIGRLDLPDVEDDVTTGPNLRMVDLMSEDMFQVIAPFFGELAIDPISRSPGWLLETSTPEDESPPLGLDDALSWYRVFSAQCLLVLIFLGPTKGHLVLSPFLDEDLPPYAIETQPGQMVILRADALMASHTSQGVAYSVASFYLDSSGASGVRAVEQKPTEKLSPIAQFLNKWMEDRLEIMKQEEVNGGGAELPVEWRRAMNHAWSKPNSVSCNGLCTRIPQGWSPLDFFTSSLPGCDVGEEIPWLRWDNSQVFYPPPEDATDRTQVPRHGSWLDGLELFDNKFFIISNAEASGMAPEQRMNLECAYEALRMAGRTKQSLLNSFTAFYSANSDIDWAQVDKKVLSTANAGACQHTSISSARCAFCLGCRGPAVTVDTGAAGGLVVTVLGMTAMCDVKVHAKVQDAACMAPHLVLHPRHLIWNFASGHWCIQGRCLTFDASTTGFARGEGIAAIALKPIYDIVDDEYIEDEASRPRRLGLLCGKALVNSGASAYLGCPSGPTEQEVIHMATRDASIGPSDVDIVECHGDSKVLPDAIEVMALTKVLCAEDDAPSALSLLCAKTNQLNTDENISMMALIRTMLSVRAGVICPNQHQRIQNPYLRLDEERAVHIPSEALESNLSSTFAGTTATNFSGMHVHIVSWGAIDRNMVSHMPAKEERQWTYFWPGGGGHLEDVQKPRKHYSIVGSWSRWKSAEPMSKDGEGHSTAIVTLGENGWEQFRIVLDGDVSKVLHPGARKAGPGTVQGPDLPADCEGCDWLIGGRSAIWAPKGLFPGGGNDEHALAQLANVEEDAQAASEGALVNICPDPPGLPGDQYRVKLKVAGKWRMVAWEKVEGAPTTGSIQLGRYYLAADWNRWQFQEMDRDADGLLTAEVGPLPSNAAGEFQIVREEDWGQVLYPAEILATDGSPADTEVLGPDEHGVGSVWVLPATPGAVFRIDFRRRIEAGEDVKQVSWQLLRQEEAPLATTTAPPAEGFFIVGSWDVCPRPRPMYHDAAAGCFKFFVQMGPRRDQDDFVLLPQGSWLAQLAPASLMPLGAQAMGDAAWMVTRPRSANDTEPVMMEIRLLVSGRAAEAVEIGEYDRTARRPPQGFVVEVN